MALQAFEVHNVTMDGSWVAWDAPAAASALLIQARTAADVQVSTDGGTTYWTVKSGDGLSLGSFNIDEQTLYFKGTSGVVVEVVAIRRP